MNTFEPIHVQNGMLFIMRDNINPLWEAKENVNGGSISIGHPFGMTGARCVGHITRELQRSDKQFGVVTMCVGGGMGASGLFERYPS